MQNRRYMTQSIPGCLKIALIDVFYSRCLADFKDNLNQPLQLANSWLYIFESQTILRRSFAWPEVSHVSNWITQHALDNICAFELKADTDTDRRTDRRTDDKYSHNNMQLGGLAACETYLTSNHVVDNGGGFLSVWDDTTADMVINTDDLSSRHLQALMSVLAASPTSVVLWCHVRGKQLQDQSWADMGKLWQRRRVPRVRTVELRDLHQSPPSARQIGRGRKTRSLIDFSRRQFASSWKNYIKQRSVCVKVRRRLSASRHY